MPAKHTIGRCLRLSAISRTPPQWRSFHHNAILLKRDHGARKSSPKTNVRLCTDRCQRLSKRKAQSFQLAKFDRPFIAQLVDRAAQQTKCDFVRQFGERSNWQRNTSCLDYKTQSLGRAICGCLKRFFAASQPTRQSVEALGRDSFSSERRHKATQPCPRILRITIAGVLDKADTC